MNTLLKQTMYVALLELALGSCKKVVESQSWFPAQNVQFNSAVYNNAAFSEKIDRVRKHYIYSLNCFEMTTGEQRNN